MCGLEAFTFWTDLFVPLPGTGVAAGRAFVDGLLSTAVFLN